MSIYFQSSKNIDHSVRSLGFAMVEADRQNASRDSDFFKWFSNKTIITVDTKGYYHAEIEAGIFTRLFAALGLCALYEEGREVVDFSKFTVADLTPLFSENIPNDVVDSLCNSLIFFGRLDLFQYFGEKRFGPLGILVPVIASQWGSAYPYNGKSFYEKI